MGEIARMTTTSFLLSYLLLLFYEQSPHAVRTDGLSGVKACCCSHAGDFLAQRATSPILHSIIMLLLLLLWCILATWAGKGSLWLNDWLLRESGRELHR